MAVTDRVRKIFGGGSQIEAQPDGEVVVTLAAGKSFSITGAWRTASLVSTTLQAGSNNDVSPGAAALWRITTNASGSTLTGIAGGAAGRRLTIVNLGPGSLVLANESASSAAANRIVAAANVTLAVNGVAQLVYDSVTARWRVVSVLT